MNRVRLVLLALVATVALTGLVPSGASAAKVGNPGAFHAVVATGSLRVKQQVFSFSEDNPVTFDGTIDSAGNVSVPPAGLHFPDTPYAASGFNLTIHILAGNSPPNPVTGTLDPTTGNVALRLRVYVKIDGVPLASNCTVGTAASPIDVNALISGTKPANGANPAITGAPYNLSAGTFTIVDNTFAVPASTGCGLGQSAVDSALGLPSASGNNDGSFTMRSDPVITRAINPSFTTTPSSGEAPLNVAFNASATTSSKTISSYKWDFDNNGTFEQTNAGPTTNFVYANPGTYTARLRVTDADGDFSDTTRTVTVNVSPPNLTINKSHSGNFRVGTTGIYTLAVTGTRGPTTGPVTVTDTLPAGLTYQSATGSGWNCGAAGQLVTCTYPAALTYSQSPPNIALNVDVGQAALPSVTNTATVSTAGDANPGDNSASDPTTVTATDVAITKTHTGTFGNFPVGPNSYSVAVHNEGTAATAGSTVVTDTLPAGLTFVSGTGAGWSCSAAGQDVTCTHATAIPAGGDAPLTLNVTAALDPGELSRSVTNTAVVATADDIDLSDNSSSDPTLILGSADLAIDKAHVGANFTAASNGSYTIDVQNRGPVAANGATVTDTLPDGLTFVSATGTNWNCGAVGQDVTCTYADPIAPGASAPTITLVVNVGLAAIPAVSNTATVTTTDDGNAPNNSDTDNVDVRQIDLVLSKASSGVFRVDRNAEYEFVVTNQGNSDTASTTTITDTLPAGETFVAGNGSGWSCGAIGQNVTCSYPGHIDGAGGQANPLTLVVALSAAASPSVTNSATVNTSDDLVIGNNSDDDTTAVVEQDVAITKTHTGVFDVGAQRTYTLAVDNVGTRATTGTTTVTDTLPAGLTYVNASGGGWACGAVGQDVTCTRAAAIAAESPTPDIQLQVQIDAAAAPSVSNTATVGSPDDRNALNDSSTNVASVPSPDLTVESSHTGAFRAGSNGTYQLTVSNDGDAPTQGTTTLTDTLPAGLSYVSASGSGWTCGFTAPDVTCTRTASIPASSDAPAVTLQVGVAPSAAPSVDNSVAVSVPGEPVTNNNSDTDTTSVTVVDAKIEMTAPAGDVVVGQDADYSLVVSNPGTAATYGTITVTDTFPAGLTPVDASGTGWTCSISGQTVTCTRSDSVAVGGSTPPIAVRVHVTPDAIPGPVSNTASVSTNGDPNSANDSATESNGVDAHPDLELGISPRNPIDGGFRVGTAGAYTLTTRNVGGIATSGATTIVVTLPAGFTSPASFSDGDWSCTRSGQTVTCTLPGTSPIASGASSSVDVPVTISSAAPASSVANATVGNSADPNATNNDASTTLPVTRVDLAIDQTPSASMVSGAQGQLSVDVSNVGTAATVSQTTVTETLPAGLTYSSASGDGWNCGASVQTVTCTHTDSIAPGASAPRINIRVALSDAAVPSVATTASVATTDDVASSNNSKTNTVAVAAKPVTPVEPTPTVPEKPVTINVKKAKATLNGFLVVTLGCPADSGKRCSGTLTLTSSGKVRTVKNGKKKKISMGTASYSVASGRTFPVSVKLSKTALKALKLTGKVKATVTAASSDKTVPKSSGPLISTYDLATLKK